MKDNGPVTQREVFFDDKNDLVSVTDIQGKIKFVNDDFVLRNPLMIFIKIIRGFLRTLPP